MMEDASLSYVNILYLRTIYINLLMSLQPIKTNVYLDFLALYISYGVFFKDCPSHLCQVK